MARGKVFGWHFSSNLSFLLYGKKKQTVASVGNRGKTRSLLISTESERIRPHNNVPSSAHRLHKGQQLFFLPSHAWPLELRSARRSDRMATVSVSLVLRNFAKEPDQWRNHSDASRRAACDCKLVLRVFRVSQFGGDAENDGIKVEATLHTELVQCGLCDQWHASPAFGPYRCQSEVLPAGKLFRSSDTDAPTEASF